MDISARLTALAKITRAASPVVSVYLNTRWADEHQRDRVRVFLKKEIRKAGRASGGKEIIRDLEWIQAEGESLIGQARFPDAHGVALFACHALELREVLPVRIPFENTFVVADAPFLRPLAAARDEIPSALVVFVDGEHARLIPLHAEGAGEEVVLQSEVPGRHRRGGWALLAQSRYQRHIQDHRGRHFEAVAEVLIGLVEGNRVERIVVAGEPRTMTAFRKHLPPRIAERIVGSISAAQYESAGTLLERATALLLHREKEGDGSGVDVALTEAAKSRGAVAGIGETLEAVSRGAVHRLYLLTGFSEPGRICGECKALQTGGNSTCYLCRRETTPVELGEAMVDRVLATGGTVETIEVHPGLTRVGGVAALLRYPL